MVMLLFSNTFVRGKSNLTQRHFLQTKMYLLYVRVVTLLRKHIVMGNANKKEFLFEFGVRETFRQKSGKFGISKFVESGVGLRIWQWSSYQCWTKCEQVQ